MILQADSHDVSLVKSIIVEDSKTINPSKITFPSHPLHRNAPVQSFRLSIGGSKIPSTLPLQNRNSPSRDRALSSVETMNLKNYLHFQPGVSSWPANQRLYMELVSLWAANGTDKLTPREQITNNLKIFLMSARELTSSFERLEILRGNELTTSCEWTDCTHH